MESKTFYIAEVDGDTSFQDQTVTARVPMLTFVNEKGIILAEIPNDNTFMEYNKTGKLQRNEFDLILKTKVFWEGDNLLLKIIVRNNEGVTATRVAVELPNEGYTILNKEENLTINTRYNPHTWEIGNLREEEEASLTLIIDPIKFKEREINILSTSTDTSTEGNPDNNRREISDRIFVIKAKKTTYDSGASSKIEGLDKKSIIETEKFITDNKNNPEKFILSCIAFKNTVEIIGYKPTIERMLNIVEQDNGKGGKEDANNREYGGTIHRDGSITEYKGRIIELEREDFAFVTLEWSKGESTFHSHPSGSIGEEIDKKSNQTGSAQTIHYSESSDPPTKKYNNAPSVEIIDKENNKIFGDIYNLQDEDPAIHYVFARKNKTVYVYNRNGVIATLPHSFLRNYLANTNPQK